MNLSARLETSAGGSLANNIGAVFMDEHDRRSGELSKEHALNALERIPFLSHGWLLLSTRARSGEQTVECAPRSP
jgi:hypothetical protein